MSPLSSSVNLHRIVTHSLSQSAGPAVFRGTRFHAAPRNSMFAAEFAASCRKMQNCPFFATLISNSRFLGFFLILQFIKQKLVVVSLLL